MAHLQFSNIEYSVYIIFSIIEKVNKFPFYYQKCPFFKVESIKNDLKEFLLQGQFVILFFKVVIDPTIYPDNRIERITERKWCSMFLVDTADNKILGIRICILHDKTYETIYDVLQTMLNRGCKSIDVVTGFQDYVIHFSSNKFIKNASYFGREKGNYRTPNLLVPTH